MSHEAEKGDWIDDFAPRQASGGDNNNRVEWMKFPEPGEYRVRLIGNPVKYLKHNDPPFPFPQRIITHGTYKAEDPAWQAGFYPSVHFAIFVLDRADGKVKVLDRSKKFFKPISNYKKNNDIDPGGREAPDFVITVEWPADEKNPKGNKRRANYTVGALAKQNTFTEEELVLVKEKCAKVEINGEEGEEKVKVSPLQIIYKSAPLDKIIEAWDALPDESKVKKEYEADKADTPVADKADTSSMEEEAEPKAETAEDDGLFGSDEETGF